jgi:anti-sigma factor RsiW
MTRPARCTQADDLWPYLDGELPAARARAVAGHVRVCPACGDRARRLRAVLETCRTAGCRKLPADVRARARARVKALLATARTKS